jgi:hypothetical protein
MPVIGATFMLAGSETARIRVHWNCSAGLAQRNRGRKTSNVDGLHHAGEPEVGVAATSLNAQADAN